jgi:branched-subunit amino acid ABC-type transport system permease component
VENREPVAVPGIDVHPAFTGVSARGGAAAGPAGMLEGPYQGSITPGVVVVIFSRVASPHCPRGFGHRLCQ